MKYLEIMQNIQVMTFTHVSSNIIYIKVSAGICTSPATTTKIGRYLPMHITCDVLTKYCCELVMR